MFSLTNHSPGAPAAPPAGPPRTARGVSATLSAPARVDVDELFRRLATGPAGLAHREAELRLARHGPNEVARQARQPWPVRLLRTAANPLVVLLGVLAAVSFATGDVRAGVVMALIGVLGVGLRFVQEFRADAAAARLKAMLRVTATVARDGQVREVPLREVVPGDLVHLAAGDMIPADLRVLSSKDLFVNQASLTGESFPVEKSHTTLTGDVRSIADLDNICFMGTSVESGTGAGVVVATGPQTFFGGMAASIAARQPKTSFDKGVDRFTWLMIRFMAAMVPLVFLVNGLVRHDWTEAFFFAVAVAVGLTPEMLPMIVSVCLAKGALAMSRRRVIVKRLAAIQDLGGMDVLCTDKTGTLTRDRVILERHCDVAGDESDDVLLHAYLISHFQTGLKNVLDRAILESPDFHARAALAAYAKLDEIPFDFARRMMSVVVSAPDGRVLLLTKGAPEEVLARCPRFELDGETSPVDSLMIEDLKEEYEQLSGDGFRVLAVATRELPRKDAYSTADERDLVLKGYVAFLDPPKETAGPAIVALRRHGIAVKLLTGDNPLVSRKVCTEVGLPTEPMLVGADVERMSDAELADAAEHATLFARLSPADKQRIIRALQGNGHVVGFLGDGINDAPALRLADVGISVDTAVDVARESAAVILLEKSLTVLDDAVLEGRKVFANILKYVRMGASSNFGNMFSVLGASAFLPFLPMAPIQVLVNNLLYDFSQVPIPGDRVDDQQLAGPRPWRIRQVERFILCMGPVSSVFDYVTFFVMLWVFGCWDPARAALFQTGWFVESLVSQTLVVHVIRTARLPLFQSRASPALTATTLLVIAVGIALPYSPLASSLGFVRPPLAYWPILVLIVSSYLAAAGLMNAWLSRRTDNGRCPHPK